jgi:hypothetical protein
MFSVKGIFGIIGDWGRRDPGKTEGGMLPHERGPSGIAYKKLTDALSQTPTDRIAVPTRAIRPPLGTCNSKVARIADLRLRQGELRRGNEEEILEVDRR